HEDLLQAIRNAHQANRIVLVTNVPQSHTRDWDDPARFMEEQARYFNRLRPEDLGDNVEVYFEYDNHAKIIATNNIAYIGSANFAPASKHNYECGVLVSGQALTRQAFEYVELIASEALRYGGDATSEALVSLAS